ncbi:MAG: hypothetical protein AABW54_05005 [Candidatus Micrarchaeota archaeon]
MAKLDKYLDSKYLAAALLIAVALDFMPLGGLSGLSSVIVLVVALALLLR